MNAIKLLLSFLHPLAIVKQFTLWGDSGGGGGGQPSDTTQTQTQITELPEWARPYAKTTLEKTAALTETPYQTYGGPRIAGFSPLQQQAQQNAANMQTSGLTGLGGQVAGAAALGGLGQQYQAGQFSGGQFSPYAAGMYMSPFIQQAMAPQLREAQRASEILGQQNAARAVGQGAFGGSRSGLVEAERQRNLGMQLGDIQSRGYQTAYEQAQNQFNQDMTRRMQAQQLGEQSRQFGANLGLQGLNTALQGAGQLGALGGQQFQQGMDINKLQSAYGGQQQALRQQGLDQAYQDFLNQQNYPYKQLGFMADMIRGLPLGQQNTRAMYEAPGSMLGQVAGIGAGLYGLSKLSNFLAEGGEVKEYADGGVTRALNDEGSLAADMDKLTDEQLQQIIQNPVTKAQLEAAQEEMAMRASERGGMAGAFNQLPQSTQQEMFTAANGGIVALSNGGDSSQYFQDPMGAPSYERSDYSPFKQNIREGEEYTPGLLGMLFGYNRLPAEKKTELAATAAAGDKFDRGTATRREDFAAPKAPAAPKVSITEAAKKASAATGVPEEDFMTTFRKLRTELQAEGKEDLKALNDQIAKMGGRSKEIREQGLGKALAEFGFNMAAAAAQPGRAGNRGLRGLLQSAATASPTLAASASRTDELARAADDNAMKMALTMKQYEIAQRKGDTQAASQMAQNMRMLQQAEKQIALKRQELAQQGGYQQAALKQRGEQFERMMGVRERQAGAQEFTARAAMERARLQGLKEWEAGPGPRLERQLMQQYGKNWAALPEASADYQRRKGEFIRGQAATATTSTPLTSLLGAEDMKYFGLSE